MLSFGYNIIIRNLTLQQFKVSVSPSEILTYFDITIYHNGNIIVLHVVSLNASELTRTQFEQNEHDIMTSHVKVSIFVYAFQ